MGKEVLILLVLLMGLTSVQAAAQPAAEQTPMAQAVAGIKLKPNWQQLGSHTDDNLRASRPAGRSYAPRCASPPCRVDGRSTTKA